MPSVVIKPEAGSDTYVVWSTITESPHAYGTRQQVCAYLRLRPGWQADDLPEDRVDRADRYGSSAYPRWGFGHWGDDTFIYRQTGLLHRRDLCRAVDLAVAGRERDLLDLLEPFDDDDGPQWLAECKHRAEEVRR